MFIAAFEISDNAKLYLCYYYTGRRARGPGLCRLLNTSRTNCFDGNINRTEDIEEFEGEDIEDQGSYQLITNNKYTSHKKIE